MPSPPIQVFLTTIASQPALRQRQEYILRILQVKKIPFTSYDLASDEAAKKLWRRKAPLDKQQLPGILVGGRFPGVFADFEEAVEYAELNKFLRLDEEWDEELDAGRSSLPARPVGVPGASTPQQVTGHKPSYAATPSPLRKGVKEMDMGEELPGFGLQGLKVTDDEIADLVKDLGLEGDEATDLVKGLSSNAPEEKKGGPEMHGEVTSAVEMKDNPTSTSEVAEKSANAGVEKVNPPVTEEKPEVTESATKDTSGDRDDKVKQKEAFAESEIEKLDVQKSAGDNET
ncbi:hypothetical protein BD410DRAFT_781140 [Rickenella mellea]|uniref:SH3 domain-binding glutamic acid-rich protein n=1 Tax=Rickenella mellea TaxID=50990 RepID=A0A4Y7QMK6_9AGAM|nr:hypothetical protein BD410DRAFT_781140 [Rickenella mellea]